MLLKTFAAIKDQIGDDISIDENFETVGQLSLYLQQKYPNVGNIIAISRFAVDMQLIENDFLLTNQKTIYILPPSSGG